MIQETTIGLKLDTREEQQGAKEYSHTLPLTPHTLLRFLHFFVLTFALLVVLSVYVMLVLLGK